MGELTIHHLNPAVQKVQSLANSSDPKALQNFFKDEYTQYAASHGGENKQTGLEFAKAQEQPLFDSGVLLKDPGLAKKFDDAMTAILPAGSTPTFKP